MMTFRFEGEPEGWPKERKEEKKDMNTNPISFETMSPKQRAAVYRNAAELILTCQLNFSCIAVAHIGGLLAVDLFQAWFRPNDATASWWRIGEIEPRVQALLLMAEMVERGDA